jgi:two-component system CheB/CheR fusion protein
MQELSAPLSLGYLAAILRPLTSPYFSPDGKDQFPINAAVTSDESAEHKGKPRALIVDDAPDVTEMLAMFLEHAGFDPVMAFSAAEALEAAQAEQFEIVISDIGMPLMNGYELATRLRSLPDYNHVPMIAVTGFSVYDDRGRALESGFNAHLTKPINPLALLNLINSLREQ